MRRGTGFLPLLATTALALLAVTGCSGGGSDPGSGSTESTAPSTATVAPDATDPAAGPATGADADLAITIRSDGTDATYRYRLVCVNGAPGEGSDHPQAQEACTFLSGDGKSLLTTSPKKGLQCTQQSAGPQRAIVEGELNGTSVQRTFALNDGCKISAWKSAEALLGRGTSAGNQ